MTIFRAYAGILPTELVRIALTLAAVAIPAATASNLHAQESQNPLDRSTIFSIEPYPAESFTQIPLDRSTIFSIEPYPSERFILPRDSGFSVHTEPVEPSSDVIAEAVGEVSRFASAPLAVPPDVLARGIEMQNWPQSVRPLQRPPGLGVPVASNRSQSKPATREALETVRNHATERNALKTDNVNLIGVFGANDDKRALIRFKNGSIRRVKVNSKILGGRVVSIDDSTVRISRSGRIYFLKLDN
ncbi:MAG: hypothetical protein OXC26_21475 [Albidovulum sp.]|nr:hypothetical protein [Albidovulum sp.]